MQAERQATITGTPKALDAWLQALSGALPAEWSRETAIEQKFQAARKSKWPICLIWSGAGTQSRMAIYLRPVSESEIGIVSIVSLERKRLTAQARAAALQAFRTAFIDPSATAVQLDENPVLVGLTDMLSPQAATRFETFIKTANPGILHSGLDLPRWYDFLFQLHREVRIRRARRWKPPSVKQLLANRL